VSLHAVPSDTISGKVRSEYRENAVPKVTASKVHSLAKAPGRHNAGGSLYLVVKGGSALWEYQFRKAKVLRSAVLGSPRGEPAVSLQEAREKAMEIRKANREERKTGVPAMPRASAAGATGELFRDAAAKFLEQFGGSWAPSELTRYARHLEVTAAALAGVPCAMITPENVADVLRPIWRGPNKKPGALMRSLIERTLDGASVRARKVGDPAYANPATWAGTLEHVLPAGEDEDGKHFAAMDYREVGALLREANDPTLSFLVHTAARLSEVTKMPGGEVVDDLWTIPGGRYKTGKVHMVPLSSGALAALPHLPPGAGAREDRMRKAIEGRGITLHGFRSAFVTWAEETAPIANAAKIAGLCLGHGKKSDNGEALSRVAKAYARSDLMQRRRELLQLWSNFLSHA
jgi:integrase